LIDCVSLSDAHTAADCVTVSAAVTHGEGWFVYEPDIGTCDFAICTMPAYAQGQQSDTAKLKADAENMVKIITGDKLKIQTYCEILDLHDQIDDANLNQDTKKATELSEQTDELKKKLGPGFSTLADDLKDINPRSQNGREIGSIIDKLDQLCGY
jgi:hypothetical protein